MNENFFTPLQDLPRFDDVLVLFHVKRPRHRSRFVAPHCIEIKCVYRASGKARLARTRVAASLREEFNRQVAKGESIDKLAKTHPIFTRKPSKIARFWPFWRVCPGNFHLATKARKAPQPERETVGRRHDRACPGQSTPANFAGESFFGAAARTKNGFIILLWIDSHGRYAD